MKIDAKSEFISTGYYALIVLTIIPNPILIATRHYSRPIASSRGITYVITTKIAKLLRYKVCKPIFFDIDSILFSRIMVWFNLRIILQKDWINYRITAISTRTDLIVTYHYILVALMVVLKQILDCP